MHRFTVVPALAALACLTLFAGGGCAGKASTPAVELAAVPLTVHRAQHGQQSSIAVPVLRQIRSRQQFDELGLEGAKAASFGKHDMVLVGLGEQSTGGHWVRVTGLYRVGDEVVVQATVNHPGEDQPVTEALSQPWCLVTTDKLGDVTLVSDFTSVSGQEPAE